LPCTPTSKIVPAMPGTISLHINDTSPDNIPDQCSILPYTHTRVVHEMLQNISKSWTVVADANCPTRHLATRHTDPPYSHDVLRSWPTASIPTTTLLYLPGYSIDLESYGRIDMQTNC
jgi:hypothetical protein